MEDEFVLWVGFGVEVAEGFVVTSVPVPLPEELVPELLPVEALPLDVLFEADDVGLAVEEGAADGGAAV